MYELINWEEGFPFSISEGEYSILSAHDKKKYRRRVDEDTYKSPLPTDNDLGITSSMGWADNGSSNNSDTPPAFDGYDGGSGGGAGASGDWGSDSGSSDSGGGDSGGGDGGGGGGGD